MQGQIGNATGSMRRLSLPGRSRFERKSVNTLAQFGSEQFIHYPMALHAREPGKVLGDDADMKMRLTAFAPAGMPVVLVAFVNDIEKRG